MNPRDIMTDAIHNFHPQYQQYTQYSSGKGSSGGVLDIWDCIITLVIKITMVVQRQWLELGCNFPSPFESK
jgi:hypothetical protein